MTGDSSVDFQLEDKVVIVTGSARGIGEAIAEAFGSAKCCVVIADRMARKDGFGRCEALAERINQSGGQGLVTQVDISERTQVEKMIQATLQKFGRVDVLVSNAGMMRGGSLLETDEDNLRQQFEINVKGSFICCQLVAKQMIKQGSGGKIVVISSVSGIEAEEGVLAYSSSKASLNVMVKCMAVELAPHKINVNAIAPGWVETEMTIPYLNKDLVKEINMRIPLGCMAKPDQIAGGALFLASPLADYITGHVLVIDGGLLSNITIKTAQGVPKVGY